MHGLVPKLEELPPTPLYTQEWVVNIVNGSSSTQSSVTMDQVY